MFEHLKHVHDDIYSDTYGFECELEECRRVKNTQADLDDHYKAAHESLVSMFACPENGCASTYKTKHYLEGHLKWKHPTIYTFVCNEEDCGFAASTQQHLDRHFNAVHTISSEKTFACPENDCTFGAKNFDDLRGHFQNKHASIRN